MVKAYIEVAFFPRHYNRGAACMIPACWHAVVQHGPGKGLYAKWHDKAGAIDGVRDQLPAGTIISTNGGHGLLGRIV